MHSDVLYLKLLATEGCEARMVAAIALSEALHKEYPDKKK